jgi:hypothetical protein
MAKEKVQLVAMRNSAFERLKEYSEKSKIPLVELSTEAVDEYLKKRERLHK